MTIYHQKENIKVSLKGKDGKDILEKPVKTLLAIQGITGGDFMFDMDCKLNMNDGRDKNSFTQKEAQEMVKIIVNIYELSHNIVSSCCRCRHDKMLEKTYKALIKHNYYDKNTLKECIEELYKW